MAAVGIIHTFTFCTSRLGIVSTSQCPRAKTKWTCRVISFDRLLGPGHCPRGRVLRLRLCALWTHRQRGQPWRLRVGTGYVSKIRFSLTDERMHFQRVVCDFACLSLKTNHEKKENEQPYWLQEFFTVFVRPTANLGHLQHLHHCLVTHRWAVN